MAELPFMPVATDALIADTSHMSATEFGAYMRILIAMWRNGGSLPDDEKALRRTAGVTAWQWSSIRETVLKPLNNSNGTLRQKRLSATMDDALRTRERRSAAAQKRSLYGVRNHQALSGNHLESLGRTATDAMQPKPYKNITSSFTGTAREGTKVPAVDNSMFQLPQDFREQAQEALQREPSLGSGELAASIQAKGWVKP